MDLKGLFTLTDPVTDPVTMSGKIDIQPILPIRVSVEKIKQKWWWRLQSYSVEMDFKGLFTFNIGICFDVSVRIKHSLHLSCQRVPCWTSMLTEKQTSRVNKSLRRCSVAGTYWLHTVLHPLFSSRTCSRPLSCATCAWSSNNQTSARKTTGYCGYSVLTVCSHWPIRFLFCFRF